MSLVGSLEDLGLGEILQIVSLSGKSGVLWIRSPEGEGRMVFDRGAIRGASAGDGPEDLRGLVIAAAALPEDEVEALHAEAQAENVGLAEVLLARTSLDAARLDELRERHVEAAVMRMFSWPAGEFNFEIRDEPGAGDRGELLLDSGMNAQFLALEGARMRDERGYDDARAAEGEQTRAADGEALGDMGSEEAFSEPDLADGAELEITVLELLGDDLDAQDAASIEPLQPNADAPSCDEEPTLSGCHRERVCVEASDSPERPAARLALPEAPNRAFPHPAERVPARRPTALIVVDADLAVLEWAKGALEPLGVRTHIFARAELAIERIRQYFARGELPVVVLTTSTPGDAVSGARDWSEIAARLRAQVASVPLVLLASADAPVVPANERAMPDALAARPSASVLADERARERREGFAGELRAAIGRSLARPPVSRSSDTNRSAPPEGETTLQTLRAWSERLRSISQPGEVLRLVLEVASRHFDRAVVFWVRDEEAHAAMQVGLPASGGPDDEALGELCVPVDEPFWFRKAIESRSPVRASPGTPDDHALIARLGAARPAEAYVAPIESVDLVAALLYADNAATHRPIGDASALEVILHEAGMSLDRAVLERVPERARSGDDG